MTIGGIQSVPRPSRTGQRAFDEAASLRPPILDEGEAASSGPRATYHPGEMTSRDAESLCLLFSRRVVIMAEINKLSVEKALDKLSAGDARQSKDARFNDKMDRTP